LCSILFFEHADGAKQPQDCFAGMIIQAYQIRLFAGVSVTPGMDKNRNMLARKAVGSQGMTQIPRGFVSLFLCQFGLFKHAGPSKCGRQLFIFAESPKRTFSHIMFFPKDMPARKVVGSQE